MQELSRKKELVIIRIYNNKITQMQESTQVLILGGSNFMGKELVDYLSQHIANIEIHLINRGKKYWYNILDIGITMCIRTILILNTSMEIATNTSK